jgi:DNA-binding transcriptional regulator YiaG
MLAGLLGAINRKSQAATIAHQLLSTLDDSAISQATGLSLEEVQAIRSDYLVS